MGGSIVDDFRVDFERLQNSGRSARAVLMDGRAANAVPPLDWKIREYGRLIPPPPPTPDPNHKRHTGKPKLSLIPLAALIPIARALEDGIVRAGYARDNWREALDPTLYHDALLRHLSAWQEGEERAADSGVEHLGHAGACLLILIWHHLCKPGCAANLPENECAVNSQSAQSSTGGA